jgi:hypothetical protein
MTDSPVLGNRDSVVKNKRCGQTVVIGQKPRKSQQQRNEFPGVHDRKRLGDGHADGDPKFGGGEEKQNINFRMGHPEWQDFHARSEATAPRLSRFPCWQRLRAVVGRVRREQARVRQRTGRKNPRCQQRNGPKVQAETSDCQPVAVDALRVSRVMSDSTCARRVPWLVQNKRDSSSSIHRLLINRLSTESLPK